ncbi:hypothetical protein [Clostridium sp. HMP27]|uniref:hypothetical protein n=1 Tax=Clostridium sp. HMP27 TaxID=1487921 RepID=UPI00069139C7|nr:hypothetical protein [Clostridium sp. HMP27]
MKNTFDTIENMELREELIMNIEVLDKVKDLLLLPNTELMTTKMVADYYEVDKDAITKVIIRHEEELLSDGAVKIKGKQFYEQYGQDVPSVKIIQTGIMIDGFDKITFRGQWFFPKRAVLRIGMLLRDSEVPKEVRTQLLNIVEKVDDKVKVADIDEETDLMLAIIKAQTDEDRLFAVSRLDGFRKRHIQQLEETIAKKEDEIQALVGERVELNNSDKFKK